jgi:hypothetical protein
VTIRTHSLSMDSRDLLKKRIVKTLRSLVAGTGLDACDDDLVEDGRILRTRWRDPMPAPTARYNGVLVAGHCLRADVRVTAPPV